MSDEELEKEIVISFEYTEDGKGITIEINCKECPLTEEDILDSVKACLEHGEQKNTKVTLQ